MAGFKPRKAQKAILDYRGGKMGVSAVPGSGKTQTLSALAAGLIRQGLVNEDQEVLIVTLVNSAVENFSSRIAGFIREAGLLEGYGYRVRTLHGLAHDIVRERPDLAGLETRFQIADESECTGILNEVVQSWLGAHPEFMETWGDEQYIESHHQFNPRREWPELVTSLANAFIRQCKDMRATPLEIRNHLAELKFVPPLLQMGYELYADYQRALNYRNAVDFDDLIRLALQVLESDPEYLARLQARWPYILEDEAQDSSRLQEEILRKLSGMDGNWVRVGDPNQAIFETFTTASPDFLINFLCEPGVQALPMPNSGRSTLSILSLANLLIRWSQLYTDNPALLGGLVEPLIQPTPPGDPQPNPPDNPEAVVLYDKAYEAERETDDVARSALRWTAAHPDQTCAILVTRNTHGSKIVEALRALGAEPVELLRNTFPTRQTADTLATILQYLAAPAESIKLARVYRSLYTPPERGKSPLKEQVHQTARLIEKCRYLEDYLWPSPEQSWLSTVNPPEVRLSLGDFRERMLRWQQATLLPVDQLLLTIAQDLYTAPADLALAHKLALLLERAAVAHPDWGLEEFAAELGSVANSERKLTGFSDDDLGFNPDAHPGQVVVATAHKAKGLEWDKVYIVSANNYDFPAALPDENFISEKLFVRGRLNLEAELLYLLKALEEGQITAMYEEPGEATLQARREYARERLRLFYVAITRARRELSITWNTGRGHSKAAQSLRGLIELRHSPED